MTGRITVRHRGGGHKRRYRIIDFHRKIMGPHEILRLEYDPNRSAHLALLKHKDTKQLSYILAANTMKAGDIVESGEDVAPVPGNCLPLSAIPPGTLIHNIGMLPGQAGKIARSAGKQRTAFFKRLYESVEQWRTGMCCLRPGHRLTAKCERLLPLLIFNLFFFGVQ
jgi:ribosomal protein L2